MLFIPQLPKQNAESTLGAGTKLRLSLGGSQGCSILGLQMCLQQHVPSQRGTGRAHVTAGPCALPRWPLLSSSTCWMLMQYQPLRCGFNSHLIWQWFTTSHSIVVKRKNQSVQQHVLQHNELQGGLKETQLCIGLRITKSRLLWIQKIS